LAVSPAIGPVIGGVIAQIFGWSAIFLVLIILGLFVLAASCIRLPETHTPSMNSSASLGNILLRMSKDPKVLAFAFLVAACNGIIFSYYAEGSFYLIDLLGLTPSLYGLSFLGIALATMVGGYLSRKMHNTLSSLVILGHGITVVLFGTTLFWSLILLFSFMQASTLLYTTLTLISMMFIMAGIGMMIPNILSLALEEYRSAVGTASALFGFFYYILISIFTFGMGTLHNGTLFPMPFYFAGIGISMYIIYKTVFAKERQLMNLEFR